MAEHRVGADVSRRPLSIPPEYTVYAERHAIHDLFQVWSHLW
jgi:hypothetical protein